MNKNKLIELRCKAWGITEDEYYCNQCSDFSLEDMARAYRRGKNKGRADLEKENAELKNKLEHRNCLDCSNHSSNLRMRNLDLEKENAELKEKLLEQKQYTEFKCNEAVKKKEIYEREHFLLTEAKEFIKKFSEFVNNGIEYDSEHPQEHTDLWNKLCAEAEHFLK